MMDVFLDGGIMMWPLLAIGFAVLWLASSTILRLRRGREGADEALRGLQAIIFWGAMAGVLGLLGTVVGFVVIAQSVTAAGGAEPSLVWGGVSVALVTVLFGILIFLLAAMIWFILRQWHARIVEREGDLALS